MRKIIIMMLLGCIALMPGCGAPPQEPAGPADEPLICEADLGDTYWFAAEFKAADSEVTIEMPHEGWSADLILYKEGAARFRSVRNNAYTEGAEIFSDASWSVDEAENLMTISVLDSEEELTAQVLDSKLYVEGYGGTFVMEKGEMPSNGAEWSPADLAGYWKLESSEIEGYEATAEELGMEGGVLFYPASTGLMADYYTINEYGDEIWVTGAPVTYLEESLSEGCENEHWAACFVPEDGTSEYYAAIINRDKLRMMIFTYAEGYEYPFLAVQTFIWQGGETGMVG